MISLEAWFTGLVSLVLFTLGVFTLRGMLALERTYASALAPLAFVYFLFEHFRLGLGGLVVAFFGKEDYVYVNAKHMVFYFREGLIRFQILNLLALCAAWAGTYLASTRGQDRRLGRDRKAYRVRVENLMGFLAERSDAIRKICLVTVMFHAIFFVLQWGNEGHEAGGAGSYVIQTLGFAAPAAFFFWGIFWPLAGRERRWFILYVAGFSFLMLAAGARGNIAIGALLFLVGHLSVRPIRLQLRHILMGTALTALMILLTVASEDVRVMFGGRHPGSLDEVGQRFAQLVTLAEVMESSTVGSTARIEALTHALFRFGARLVEPSALNVIARTPEEVPSAGWTVDDWEFIRTGWIPGSAFTVAEAASESAVPEGARFLYDYGWHPLGVPVTVLADSWRRFGWMGVLVVHLALGFILTTFSMALARRRNLIAFIFGGAVLSLVASFPILDLLTLITSFPRRLLLGVLYTAFVGTVYRPLCRLRSAVAGPPSGHRVQPTQL